ERAGASLAPRAGRDALPAQQEAHEVARADRLDLAAQPALGVGVNAREQMPRAHLGLAARGIERPAQRIARRLERGDPALDLSLRKARAPAQLRVRRRPDHREVAAQRLGDRGVVVLPESTREIALL